jgi:hypothetical protein
VERIRYVDLLRKKLTLRNLIAPRVPLDAMHLTLNELLMIEQRFLLLKEILESNSLEEAMIRFEKAVPCLLHLENRSSECIIYQLLLKGWRFVEGDKPATEEFIRNIELLVNQQLFGNAVCPSNWKFPVEKDGSLGEVKLANWRARRIVTHIDLLVDNCISADKEEERQRWKDTISLYTETIQVFVIFSSVTFSFIYI